MADKKRILLVDDEAMITRTLAMYIEATGKYQVKAENDATEALRAARSFKPHLILLDIMMPEMDGSEIAAQIKEDPALCDTPIVFLTALVKRHEVGAAGKDIGGFPFLAKPVDPEKVIECIEKYVS